MIIIPLIFMASCTSILILNVNVATFSYVSQMPHITLIIVYLFCNFKGIKLYNPKKAQLAKLLSYIDKSELNLQNEVDLWKHPGFVQVRGYSQQKTNRYSFFFTVENVSLESEPE